MARNGVLESLNFSLADLYFPSEYESIEFGATKEVLEADHALPFGLLVLTMVEPSAKYSGQSAPLLRFQLALKRVYAKRALKRFKVPLISVLVDAFLELLQSGVHVGAGRL